MARLVYERFSSIDGTARYVVTDEADATAPTPFWSLEDAEARAADLWDEAYRPILWRRMRSGDSLFFASR